MIISRTKTNTAKKPDDIKTALQNLLSKCLDDKQIIVLCIGSTRIISDSLGPTVGYLLTEKYKIAVPVFGTIYKPVNALNLHSTLDYIGWKFPKGTTIAIDSFANKRNRSEIKLVNGSIKPGLASGKNLRSCGDISIIASIEENNACCSMGQVFETADKIAYLLSSFLTTQETERKTV